VALTWVETRDPSPQQATGSFCFPVLAIARRFDLAAGLADPRDAAVTGGLGFVLLLIGSITG